MNFEDKFDYTIKEPLFNTNGTLNKKCLEKIEEIIDMPTYKRLANDPEWNEQEWTFLKEITGAFAYWAIRQLQYIPYPPDLINLIGYLHTCLQREFERLPQDRITKLCSGRQIMVKISLCEINRLLYYILMDVKCFLEWNKEEIMQDDWLDLGALLHNVCLTIRDERRVNKRFDEG